MLIGEEKYISRAIKLFNSSSTAIKLTVLGIIALYILIVFLVIKRSKPIEGVTKGKVWIVNIVGYGLIGIFWGFLFALFSVVLIEAVDIFRKSFGFSTSSETFRYLVGFIITMIIHLTFFIVANNSFLKSPKNIGLEESMTPKKYVMLILKLIWYGFLMTYGLGFLFFYILYKLLFGVSKVADTVQNTRDYFYKEQDDITLNQYETGDYETKEKLREEAENISQRRKNRQKNGKFW
jgi:hypothetical protein